MKLIKIVIIIMLIGLIACEVSQDNNKIKETNTFSNSNKKYKIALVMKTLTNPFFETMEKGARKAELEHNIDLIVKTGSQETAINQQVSIIRKLIEDKVDAIVIAPADSYQLVEILAHAQKEGIVIVNIDNKLDTETSAKYHLTDVPFISVDNEEGAYLATKYIADQVNKVSRAVVIEGIEATKNSQARKAGAIRAFQENPQVVLVDVKSANWKIEEAYIAFHDLWKKHGFIDLVFCANDMMAYGVVKFLEENKIKNVKLAGFDNLAQTAEYIDKGIVSATIDQQAFEQGYQGINTAIKLLNKEELDSLNVTIDVKLITDK